MSEDLSDIDPASIPTDAHADGTVYAVPLTNREALEAAQSLAAENLAECCRELVEMDATGVLGDGIVREIAALTRPFAGHSALSLALNLVKNLAVRRCAEGRL